MQVEYVAGVRLTSRGALQQETQRTVGYRVLGKVVVNYQDVAESLAVAFTIIV